MFISTISSCGLARALPLFDPIPSVSASVELLAPISGNRRRWNSCAMVHVSWFLDMPEDSAGIVTV
ncbi:MAG: hypothetical protein NNA21_02570 [Nitrospira sp.]|nr:hypothetical protein [Nitrospira sp.]MCP9461118.1 hypothetical protein [Nitrospira sp.]MCP9473783.1 hypothetical protein [Nitrospira sp.]